MQNPPHLRLIDGNRLKVQIQFEPKGLWIGLFWRITRDVSPPTSIVHLFVCVVPCFPLHITWLRYGRASSLLKGER